NMRSGDAHVQGSRRYRDFESYLIAKESWDNLVNAGSTGLAITSDAASYLQSRKETLTQLMKSLQSNLPDLTDISIDPDGTWHLSSLDSEVPAEVKLAQRRIYNLFPRVSIPDLLVQVNATLGFLRHFTHISSGEPVSGERQLVLLAAITASGLNHGLTKMADSCPYSYKQLAGARDLYIREETLSLAQAEIDNYVLHSPVSKVWGDGTSLHQTECESRLPCKPLMPIEMHATLALGAESPFTITWQTLDCHSLIRSLAPMTARLCTLLMRSKITRPT
ncbi:MAG: Tn3 family transposase, partial [Candidatus Melainabacteria bacterium]|nr:Tn3 family transposase [Candidatus Melainabacteria bacterium]